MHMRPYVKARAFPSQVLGNVARDWIMESYRAVAPKELLAQLNSGVAF